MIIRTLSIIALIFLLNSQAMANDVAFNRPAQTGVAEVTLDTYARRNSSFILDYKNSEQGGNARATLTCGALGANKWTVSSVTGTCLDVEFCYDVPTDSADNIIQMHLSDKTITKRTIKANTNNQVTNICYQLRQPASNLDVVINETSKCDSDTMLSPKTKGLCAFGSNPTSQISADTGDDMFKMLPATGSNNGAFIEYPAVGDLEHPFRLRWIERGAGGSADKAIMIPSGPPGSFRDFELFMQNPPYSVAYTEPACYPVTASLCTGVPTMPTAPPAPGLCGAAHGETFDDIEEILSAGRCYIGAPSEIVENEGQATWTCAGVPASQPSATCRADLADTSVEHPKGTDNTPTESCFFQASRAVLQSGPCWFVTSPQAPGTMCYGIGLNNSNIGGAQIAFAGPGEYPRIAPPNYNTQNNTLYTPLEYPMLESLARLSPNLTMPGWASIALGPDTHVTIYAEPNFQGAIRFQGKGPLMLIDRDKSTSLGWSKPDWDGTKNPWKEPENSIYPFSVRQMYTSWPGMHIWAYNGSMKVSCEGKPPPSYWAYSVLDRAGTNGMDATETLKLVWEGKTIFTETRRCPNCSVSYWMNTFRADSFTKQEMVYQDEWLYERGERINGNIHASTGTVTFKISRRTPTVPVVSDPQCVWVDTSTGYYPSWGSSDKWAFNQYQHQEGYYYDRRSGYTPLPTTGAFPHSSIPRPNQEGWGQLCLVKYQGALKSMHQISTSAFPPRPEGSYTGDMHTWWIDLPERNEVLFYIDSGQGIPYMGGAGPGAKSYTAYKITTTYGSRDILVDFTGPE